MKRAEKAARAQGRPSDGATAERVAQASQLFAKLTQPGQPRINGVFEPTGGGDCRCYTRFRAWASLYHGGDLSAAARAARQRTALRNHLQLPPVRLSLPETGRMVWRRGGQGAAA